MIKLDYLNFVFCVGWEDTLGGTQLGLHFKFIWIHFEFSRNNNFIFCLIVAGLVRYKDLSPLHPLTFQMKKEWRDSQSLYIFRILVLVLRVLGK